MYTKPNSYTNHIPPLTTNIFSNQTHLVILKLLLQYYYTQSVYAYSDQSYTIVYTKLKVKKSYTKHVSHVYQLIYQIKILKSIYCFIHQIWKNLGPIYCMFIYMAKISKIEFIDFLNLIWNCFEFVSFPFCTKLG